MWKNAIAISPISITIMFLVRLFITHYILVKWQGQGRENAEIVFRDNSTAYGPTYFKYDFITVLQSTSRVINVVWLPCIMAPYKLYYLTMFQYRGRNSQTDSDRYRKRERERDIASFRDKTETDVDKTTTFQCRRLAANFVKGVLHPKK